MSPSSTNPPADRSPREGMSFTPASAGTSPAPTNRSLHHADDLSAPADFDLSQVVIRLATDTDLPHLRELFRESILEGLVGDNDTGADIDNLQQGYFADDGASGFWVAERDGTIIGMIGVQKTADSAAEVRRLRVRGSHRRRGVGALLMERALAFCREHGYLKIVLDVRIERGPAISLFEKFGFSHTRTRDIDGRKILDFYLDLYRDPKR
jgi:ribosomal protein S18 acetylase RimI-like enzyme